MYNNIDIFHKMTNMTSAISPLASLRDRLRQALSRCSAFPDPVFSKTPGTRMVILNLFTTMRTST